MKRSRKAIYRTNKVIWFHDEEIRTWEQLTGFTSSASKSFTMISIILGAIGTVVAGITIFIIIFVSIVNKRRQIGILKAIGMKEYNNFIICYAGCILCYYWNPFGY